jgi:hypothetical protein
MLPIDPGLGLGTTLHAPQLEREAAFATVFLYGAYRSDIMNNTRRRKQVKDTLIMPCLLMLNLQSFSV